MTLPPRQLVIYRDRPAHVLQDEGEKIWLQRGKTTILANPYDVDPIFDVTPKRQRNPLLLPFAVGCLAGGTLVFWRVGGAIAPGDAAYVEVEDCSGAIVLVGPSKNVVERGIDFFTGKKGFSHCALYCCLVDSERNPLVIDCQHKIGSQLRPLSDFKNRAIAWVPLSASDTAYARGAALARLGTPYRGRPGGYTCSEFLHQCLPPVLQRKILESGTRLVTPNSIAQAYGVIPKGLKPAEEHALQLKNGK